MKLKEVTTSEDRSDWNVEDPELIECCGKCKMPNKQVVKSKSVGYYLCLCNWDTSNTTTLNPYKNK